MSGRLDGRVALITGAAQGQGAEHAKLFVSEGAQVILADVLIDEGERISAELGENAEFVKLDVTREDDWCAAVNYAEFFFGPIDVLVNNAGILIVKTIEDLSANDMKSVMDVNFMGQFFGIKAVLESMKRARSGSIVNISSIAAYRGMVGCAAYGSSKFASTGLTKTAAIELAEYNIRVNSVHPGVIKTPMVQIEGADGDAIDEIAQAAPMKRAANPEEVAKLVLFLASEEAGYCTGAEFVIDGGANAKQ